MTALTSGQAAQEAGVNIETLRFYERKGLIDEPPRLESGHRRYPSDVIARIRFIKNAQELGFSLNEIDELLSLRIESGSTAADVRQRVVTKIADIDQKMRRLRAMKKSLRHLAEACSGCGPVSECPILDNLDS